MTPSKLSLSDFLLSLSLSPRLVIELLVPGPDSSIYLLKRNTDPQIGTWHLPGGFLLKGELIADCVDRLLLEELNSQPVSWEFVELVEDIDGDPRGHLLHYFVKLTNTFSPQVPNGQFFSHLPANTMSFQVPLLNKFGYK